MVRAKIAALSNDEDSQARLGQYLHLAARFTQPSSPFVLLMHGFSGCGKSRLAARLVPELHLLQVRSDIERKRLAGIDPLARGEASLYTREMSQRTHARLAQIMAVALQARCNVCLDATLLHQEDRKLLVDVAERHGAPWLILALDAPQDVLRTRLASRRSGPSDADVRVLDLQLASAEPLTSQEQAHALVIDTTREEPLHELVSKIRERLAAP